MASLAALDNLAGSKASQIRTWVSRRIIGRRLRNSYGRLVGHSGELYCGGGSFLDLLGLKNLPIIQRNYRRFHVSNNLSFPGHEAEDIVVFRLYWDDLDDGLAALGDDNGFAGGLYVIHYREATGFERAG